MLKHLKEYPLSPPVVILIGGVDSARPVKGEAHLFKLLRKVMYVVVGGNSGMDTGFYSVVFGRKTEGVKAYREQNVIALKPLFAGYYLQSGISLDMTNVHSRSRRVRKLN